MKRPNNYKESGIIGCGTLLGTAVSGRGCWLSNVTFRSAKHSDPLSQPQHLHTDSTRLIETQKHIALFYHTPYFIPHTLFYPTHTHFLVLNQPSVLLVPQQHGGHAVLGHFPQAISSYMHALDASPTRFTSNYDTVPRPWRHYVSHAHGHQATSSCCAGIPPFSPNQTGGASPRHTGKSDRDLCPHTAAMMACLTTPLSAFSKVDTHQTRPL